MATPLVTEQAIDRLIQAGLDELHVDCNQQLAEPPEAFTQDRRLRFTASSNG